MLKRILFTVMTLLVCYSAILVGYRIYEPETGESILSEKMNNALDFETLQEYSKSTGVSSIHYYFFCSSRGDNSLYIENTVLPTVASKVGQNVIDLIEFVDIADVDPSILSAQLKEYWGISSYPAFAACRYDGTNIIVENTLEWNPQEPLSANELENWLILNKLSDGETNVPIDTVK